MWALLPPCGVREYIFASIVPWDQNCIACHQKWVVAEYRIGKCQSAGIMGSPTHPCVASVYTTRYSAVGLGVLLRLLTGHNVLLPVRSCRKRVAGLIFAQ
jgi:hypothetical protein